MKEEGKPHQEIAQTLNIGQSTWRLYWKLFKSGGRENLEHGQRGRPVGARRTVNTRQEKAIQMAITDKTEAKTITTLVKGELNCKDRPHPESRHQEN